VWVRPDQVGGSRTLFCQGAACGPTDEAPRFVAVDGAVPTCGSWNHSASSHRPGARGPEHPRSTPRFFPLFLFKISPPVFRLDAVALPSQHRIQPKQKSPFPLRQLMNRLQFLLILRGHERRSESSGALRFCGRLQINENVQRKDASYMVGLDFGGLRVPDVLTGC
jgi:hypothetical protein